MNTFNPLFEQNPSLPNDQTVYRTLDFFSAASIITTKKVMFTRADMFEDKNEGIERLLSQLSISSPRSGCGMGWNNSVTAQLAHKDTQRSHYISCWSRNPDSVAMWSLYSPDCSAVRISTRVSKLNNLVNNFLSKYLISNLSENDIGRTLIGSTRGKIIPVRYISLAELSKKIQRRAKALTKIDNYYEKMGVDTPLFGKSSSALDRRLNQGDQLKEIGSLKDLSLKHEEEIRLIVRLGEEVCTKYICEHSLLANPDHEYHKAYNFYMEAWGNVKNSQIPEREFIECSSDFIETVAIDPRCPKHKFDFMAEWFNAHKIKMVKSECFGYLPDHFEVFPSK